ncbi:hypothetical protein MATR_04590 [Marivirga tractuosa]|uniref:Uncharacterized protein n=1 Tax=Marivirga tractuosa (strain ATCC 23168 / DSM 4126 / NBRC 15989 / NCIMB 1408 / VKM B-1430 / H-43) TaxID=643867 RepID=E4TT77_MARTH|nr:hypothetical protein [Marivirga tractuosa]ADR21907.1 hypothetical protein Ftrac_1922 [Marivirga tractuosa DSM 4126]BDD13634.1 hypothetical protein MATR_04590 [Marivirga tractuosa]
MIVTSINWSEYSLKKYNRYALIVLFAIALGFPLNPKNSSTNFIERLNLPSIAYPISIFVIFLLLLLVVLSIVRFPKNVKKHKIEIDSDKFSFGEESIYLGNIEYELSFKSNDKIEGKQIWDFTILKPMKKSHTLLLSFDEKEVFENLLKGDN